MSLTRSDFSDDFHWGVSTAAFQIEGAFNTGGKGQSIWDSFSGIRGKIYGNENAKVSCDFYHQYVHDLLLINQLNIPNYRFSLSWSRIFPQGTGAVNHNGADFYNRVIDFCLELGIEPWITLYHWDLPQALHLKGGWTNREIISWFEEYVSFCVKNYGDRVKHWMVLNEPLVFTGAGYFLGRHAPGKKGLSNFLAAAHHAALCQSAGGRIIRSNSNEHSIGTTFSTSHVEPYTQLDRDIQAAKKIDTLLNRMFIEPLLGMGYPSADLKILSRIEKYMQPDDESKLPFDMDFIGIQNYTREIVSYSPFTPLINARIVPASSRKVPITTMNWEVFPQSIYYILKKFNAYKGVREIIVTENGAAFDDDVSGDRVYDDQRVEYLQNHIEQVSKARKEGVKVNGYFVWTLMDNFEWAEGYRPRFGLVHVNFKTQQRIIKSSGHWYKGFLKGISEPILNEVHSDRI